MGAAGLGDGVEVICGCEGCTSSLVEKFVAGCPVCALGKAIKRPCQPLTVIKTTTRAHRYQVRVGVCSLIPIAGSVVILLTCC